MTAPTRRCFTAARPYHEDDLSQRQIADRIGVSRSTVSRLLQLARE
jgi:DNA-binding transcriptional regulator LsrR (DeoR family)